MRSPTTSKQSPDRCDASSSGSSRARAAAIGSRTFDARFARGRGHCPNARAHAGRRGNRWDIDIDGGLAAAFDLDDLNDVLGNLMENASRVALSRVRVRATAHGKDILIAIADNGPAVDPTAISGLIARGARLDESGGSAGLGLAIVADILAAHNSAPHFAASDLGGLEVSFPLSVSTV